MNIASPKPKEERAASPERELAEPEPKRTVMTTERLARLLEQMGPMEGDRGAMRVAVDGVDVTCLTDERYDRMRLVVPITETSKMSAADKDRVLQANFRTALDARYAVYDDVLFSAFIHPLSTLDEPSVRSAVRQVVNLAKSYGTSYSSGELTFGRP